MKKTYLLLAFLAAICSGSFAQNVNIPDANFKAALLAHDPVIDTNGDDEIQVTEAAAFDGLLNLFRLNITDATGLEAFINIKKLDIRDNSGLNTLDVSANTKLTFLNSAVLPITSIDLSQNILLDTLHLYRCSLASIDLSNNTALIQVWLPGNNLTSLDVTNNVAIKHLLFGGNQISAFNFPPVFNTSLEGLGYGDNPLANTFDFTIFPNLKDLRCSGSELTSLDVSMLSDLELLVCSNNPITNLDLSQNTSLTTLEAAGMLIKDLDLSQNPDMISLNLSTHELNNDYLSAIETINLANGANDKMKYFFLAKNYNLACVLVDDPFNPFPNLLASNFDGFSNFSDICVDGTIFFADVEFEDALLEHDPIIDTNADGIITEAEAMAFSGTLNLASRPIKNVREISFFTNITEVDLSRTEVRNLDLSQNTQLTSIDLSYITELSVLSLDNGNNEDISSITFAGTYRLDCMTVDDPSYSDTHWTFTPTGIGFSTDCEVPMYQTIKSGLISAGHDLNGDGEIQVSEAEAVTGELDFYNASVRYDYGIEALINISGLILGGNSTHTAGLRQLDLSQNPRLRNLELSQHYLPFLDLSVNRQLRVLNIRNSLDTRFKTLDLSNQSLLTQFTAYEGYLEDIDVSMCRSLTSIVCSFNNISALDLSNSPLLRLVRCNDNNLSSLNLRNGNNENIITSYDNMDMRNNPNLTCIGVDDPVYAEANFTNIDVGVSFDPNCSDLPIVFQDTNLENALLNYSPVIDLNADGDIRPSEAAAFTGVLNLSGLSIATALELEYFTSATGLDISNNQLTELNIKNGNNENFTVFDATGNAGLTCIKVDNAAYSTNNWTDIDAGANFSAYCDGNEIVYIPDPFLKPVLLLAADTDDDDEVSYSEALAYTGEVKVGTINTNLQDMTGIEAFENLDALEIDGQASLSELNITVLTKLKSFRFLQRNQFNSEIDLSNNLQLELIDIGRVPMSDLDLTLYPNLTSFNCFNCELGGINTTQNLALEYLSIYNDDLGEIDLSNNTMLTDLYLSYTQLNSLDLTGLSNIERMSASGNNFTSLDFSMLENLKTIEMQGTNVTSIDLSNNPLLERIDIYGGQSDGLGGYIIGELQEIIFPSNPTKLGYVYLSDNKIQDIDISMILFEPDVFGQANLSFVNLSGNDLRKINIGKVYELNILHNPNLTCASTTDIAYAEANYSYDNVSFNTDICATPTDIVLSSTSFDENSVNAVGTFTTTDESVNDVHEYTFFEDGTETSNALFEIIDDELFPKTAFDFENEDDPTYLIQIQSDDGFGGIITKQFMIALSNVNEAPTGLDITNRTIDESNPVGTVIGILSTEDVDEGDIHTYTVADGCTVCRTNESSYFTIVGNELRSSVVFDFETNPSYGIDVTTTDAGGNTWTDGYIITINDLLTSVTAVTLDVSTIKENEPASTLVGTLSTTGEDLSGSYTYGLVTGTGDDDNASFTITGGQLFADESFNHEVKNSYSILVKTDDGNGHTLNQQLTILIGNVSESTDTNILTFVLAEQTGAAEIDNINNTVAIEVARGTDLTALNPTITVSEGATISPNGVRDFSSSVTYTITAEEPTVLEVWTVTVTEALSNGTDILAFVLTEQTGEASINATNHTVSIEVETGTDLSALTPTVTLSAGATATPVGEQDFSAPLTYAVTAEDGSTTQDWIVTVTVEEGEITAINSNGLMVSSYPNPTSDWLTIISPYRAVSNMQLFDIQGQLMMVQEVNQQTTISVQTLEAGLYLMKLTNQDITTTTKILIRR